jgi:hypothetical protein
LTGRFPANLNLKKGIMKIIPKVLLTIAMFMGAICSKGQQDPMYTQYIFNLQTINHVNTLNAISDLILVNDLMKE